VDCSLLCVCVIFCRFIVLAYHTNVRVEVPCFVVWKIYFVDSVMEADSISQRLCMNSLVVTRNF
jgi:hypothetical protein